MSSPNIQAQAANSARVSVASADGLRRRVLCVDDNPLCLHVVREVLARSGCMVDCAADGEQAAAHPELAQFDVLVTDHDMPNMNGLQLVQGLRRAAFSGKVVVISASVGPQEQAAYRALGVDAIMPKPFSATGLLRIVHGG